MYGRIGVFLLFLLILIYLGLDLGFSSFVWMDFMDFLSEVGGWGAGVEKVWFLIVDGWIFKSGRRRRWLVVSSAFGNEKEIKRLQSFLYLGFLQLALNGTWEFGIQIGIGIGIGFVDWNWN